MSDASQRFEGRLRLPNPTRHGVDEERDDAIDPDARICEFCGTLLSGQTGWSYHGKGYRWSLRSMACFGECGGSRGSVTALEIETGDVDDDRLDGLRESLRSERTPYGANQSTFQPALGLDPSVPDGTYHVVRITPYVVELRPPVGVDDATVRDWVESGYWDWTKNVEVVPTRNDDLDRPVVLFRDRHNGPTAKRASGGPTA